MTTVSKGILLPCIVQRNRFGEVISDYYRSLCCLPQVDVRVVSTEHAKHFYDPTEISVKVYGDQDEWEVMIV